MDSLLCSRLFQCPKHASTSLWRQRRCLCKSFSVVASATPNNFWGKGFVKTVELAPGGNYGQWNGLPGGESAGRQFMASGAIDATVLPDLPPISSALDLLPFIDGRRKEQHAPLVVSQNPEDSARGQEWWQVRTVAAQVANRTVAQDKMKEAAHKMTMGGCTAGSLLLVSGGHPVRALPLVRPFLPNNSLKMLKDAHEMRKEGKLPEWLQFWAVENPLTNDVASLEAKLEAGAEAIILQPPLLPNRFMAWWSAARDRGLISPSSPPVLVGLPLISSPKNLAFWMLLARASGPEARAVQAEFNAANQRIGSGEVRAKAQFRRDWFLQYLSLVRSLPGVAGVHLMPVTPRGWRDLDQNLRDNLI